MSERSEKPPDTLETIAAEPPAHKASLEDRRGRSLGVELQKRPVRRAGVGGLGAEPQRRGTADVLVNFDATPSTEVRFGEGALSWGPELGP